MVSFLSMCMITMRTVFKVRVKPSGKTGQFGTQQPWTSCPSCHITADFSCDEAKLIRSLVVHSLSLPLLLLFNDFVGLQCYPLLMHQLLPLQLPAGLSRQTLLICHEQLASLRGSRETKTTVRGLDYREQWFSSSLALEAGEASPNQPFLTRRE